MRRRVIVTFAILAAAMLFGAWLGSQSPYATAQSVTPTPPYPVAPVIPGAGTQVQLWMAGPFCVDTWWGAGQQCAEHKGDELHIGAGWKLDLPGPAWIAPQGKDAQGRWLLWSVAKDNEQPPGSTFVAVIGPSLFTVPDLVTASPIPPTSTATVTPPPRATATPSPTVASGATVTPSPSPQGGTPTPTRSPITTPTVLFGNMCRPDPTPVYPHSITIYGQGGLTAPAMFWYCVPKVTPDLIYIVPEATYEAAYDNGPRQLLIDLGR